MTFNELQDKVIEVTNRPELVAETRSAIMSATLKMHGLDDFWRDRVEGQLNTPTPAYQQQFSLSGNFPQLKKVAYIRPYDGATQRAGKKLTPTNPTDVFCCDGTDKTNMWWLNGDSVVIKTAQKVNSFLFGYFRRPIVTPIAQYDSWMATQHPWAIIDEAAATIFASIGFDASAQLYRAKVGEKVPVPTGHIREILMAQLEYGRDLGE